MSDDIRQLSRQMKQLAAAVPRQAAAAINRALPRIERAMEQEAPRGSGALVASIHVVPAAARRNPRGQVEASAPYAGQVEFGTSDTHAGDFVDRALDREGPRALDQVANEIARLF